MLDDNGYEIPDPKPMARPLHIKAEESLADKIKRMVRSELSRQAEDEGHESFEDADDFDVGDDPELASPYELSDSNFEERYGDRQSNGREASGKRNDAGTADVKPNADNGQSESNGGKPGATGSANQPSGGDGKSNQKA